MRALLAVALLAGAAYAVPADAGCVGVQQAGFCSEAGCTDMCHWDMWIYCDVDKAGKVCDLVDPT